MQYLYKFTHNIQDLGNGEQRMVHGFQVPRDMANSNDNEFILMKHCIAEAERSRG